MCLLCDDIRLSLLDLLLLLLVQLNLLVAHLVFACLELFLVHLSIQRQPRSLLSSQDIALVLEAIEGEGRIRVVGREGFPQGFLQPLVDQCFVLEGSLCLCNRHLCLASALELLVVLHARPSQLIRRFIC